MNDHKERQRYYQALKNEQLAVNRVLLLAKNMLKQNINNLTALYAVKRGFFTGDEIINHIDNAMRLQRSHIAETRERLKEEL